MKWLQKTFLTIATATTITIGGIIEYRSNFVLLVTLGLLSYPSQSSAEVPLNEQIDPKEIILPQELQNIANCESGNRHFTDSGEVLRGRVNPLDIGRFQLNAQYWQAEAEKLGFDIFDETDNARMALWIYEMYGTRPWYLSEFCWGAK